MSYDTILTRKQDRIGIITLNQPASLNALSGELMDETTDALRKFTDDPDVRVIILNAEGRAFCSGFDLKSSADNPDSSAARWREALEPGFDFIMQFMDCPKPTICAVHGAAVAGGFELALACDITIAAEGSKIGEPEVRFGSAMVALILPWLMPAKPAREILLTGDDRIELDRAYQMGLINHVVPAGEEMEKALDIAYRIAASAEISIQLTKRAINRTYETMGMRQALLAAVDTAIIIDSTGSPERREFNRICREDGLKAALVWRDAQAQRPANNNT